MCKVWVQLVMSKNMYRFIKGPFENRLLSVFVIWRHRLTKKYTYIYKNNNGTISNVQRGFKLAFVGG